jgi:coiled-coil domain-containing protein 12
MSDNLTTLTAATQDRKARLAQLKSLKRKAPPADEQDEAEPREVSLTEQDETAKSSAAATVLSGRNYDAETRGPKLGFEVQPDEGQVTVEEQARLLAEETKKQAEKEAQDDKPLDLFKLQPKKPNWDLKRDLNRKMEVLNVRTDNAIAKLVRERIKKAQDEARLKGAGNDGEAVVGMEGTILVEAVHQREKEEEEDERREREADEALMS